MLSLGRRKQEPQTIWMQVYQGNFWDLPRPPNVLFPQSYFGTSPSLATLAIPPPTTTFLSPRNLCPSAKSLSSPPQTGGLSHILRVSAPSVSWGGFSGPLLGEQFTAYRWAIASHFHSEQLSCCSSLRSRVPKGYTNYVHTRKWLLKSREDHPISAHVPFPTHQVGKSQQPFLREPATQQAQCEPQT